MRLVYMFILQLIRYFYKANTYCCSFDLKKNLSIIETLMIYVYVEHV